MVGSPVYNTGAGEGWSPSIPPNARTMAELAGREFSHFCLGGAPSRVTSPHRQRRRPPLAKRTT